jgi:hypothetical protein
MPKYVRTKVGFNSTQIKDGKIVRMRKDGRIAAVLDTYPKTEDK